MNISKYEDIMSKWIDSGESTLDKSKTNGMNLMLNLFVEFLKAS